MPCYRSITGWQSAAGGPLAFGDRPPKPSWKRLQVPCGQCIGCRLETSRQWAMRLVLEGRLHTRSWMATFTYSDEQLPADFSLNKQHLTRCLHRIRKQKGSFRYYACGEYGDLTQRAHYHACLFGLDFQDLELISTQGGHSLYNSAELDRLWGHGHTSLCELNFETAAYCARYVLKKKLTINKQRQHSHYRLDTGTGELIPVQHPYAVMSLRPAIALRWLENYHGDIYAAEKDFLVMRGKKMKPAKYFDRVFDKIDNTKMEKIKQQRIDNAKHLTLGELRAHEKITRARIIQRKQV